MMASMQRWTPAGRLRLGRLLMTRGIDDRVAVSESLAIGVLDALRRHARGDWGEVCEADRKANDWSLAHGERLLSAYAIDGERVWIITESDRSATTILFPREY